MQPITGIDLVGILRPAGRIAELGSHRELIERGGYYASLVARQTRGLLPDASAGA